MNDGVVIVTGMPASGKTSVIDGAIGKGLKYKVITIGTLMADMALKKKLVKNRDRLRYLSPNAIDSLRHSAFTTVSKARGAVVVNTHASVEQNGRFVTGLPEEEMRRLKVKGLIYIDANPRSIAKRRASDRSRSRENESEMEIATQRQIDISTLAHYASYLNISLYIIQNKEGALKETQTRFKEALKNIFGEF